MIIAISVSRIRIQSTDILEVELLVKYLELQFNEYRHMNSLLTKKRIAQLP